MKTLIHMLCVASLMTGVRSFAEGKDLQGPKKRIAVSAFKDKSGHHYRHWNTVGEGMADMLTTELHKTGKFIVVERNALPTALEEQMLASEGRVQAATGAKKGELIG